jgi:transposase
MRTTRKVTRYEPSFRQNALDLVKRSNRPLDEIASSLGVPKATLYFWWRESMGKIKKKGKAAASARSAVVNLAADSETPEEKLARLEAENEALRKRVASLEEDKDILKKFAAFSVREKT